MGTVALSKVLNVREKEKVDAQKAYSQAMASFEEVATHLYQLLKKKEKAEETYEESMYETTSIEVIRQQMDYIDVLSKKIMNLQHKVQKAREEMDVKHGKLKHAHVEVKKFERIIENRIQTEEEITKKQDEITMDEISIQQYLSHTN